MIKFALMILIYIYLFKLNKKRCSSNSQLVMTSFVLSHISVIQTSTLPPSQIEKKKKKKKKKEEGIIGSLYDVL